MEAAALKLPANDRAAFAQRMLASLDPDTEERWAVEVERRIAEIESGAAPTIPLSEALAQVRASVK
ncbi:putative addiction module component [compost metagenome]